MGTVRGSRRGDSIPDAESRRLAHRKHCPHTESDVLRIEQSELRHFKFIYSKLDVMYTL